MQQYSRKNILKTIIYVICGILYFLLMAAIASYFVGIRQVVSQVKEFSVLLLLVLLSLSLTNYLLRAWRWYLFSLKLDLNISLTSSIVYYLAGFTFTTTPGKIGEGLRLWFINKDYGYRYEQLVPLFITDKLSDLHAILLLCLISLGMLSTYMWVVCGILFSCILLTYLLIRPNNLIKIVDAIARKINRLSGLCVKINFAIQSSANLIRSPTYWYTLILSILGWMVECAELYLILEYLDSSISFVQAVFIFSIASLAGVISLLPGGLGSAEITIIALLLSVGCPADKAVTASFIVRLSTLWFAVGLGFVTLPFLYYPNKLRQARPVHIKHKELS